MRASTLPRPCCSDFYGTVPGWAESRLDPVLDGDRRNERLGFRECGAVLVEYKSVFANYHQNRASDYGFFFSFSTNLSSFLL